MREHPSSRIDFRSDTVTNQRRPCEKPCTRDRWRWRSRDDPPSLNFRTCGELVWKRSGAVRRLWNDVKRHCPSHPYRPGDEIVCDKTAHIYRYEGGGYAALCGASIALVDGEGGLMTPEQVRKAVRKAEGSGSHYPNGSLVCVENTSNLGGGACYDQNTLDEIATVARELDCKTHIDGARIFNAALATGVDVARMCEHYDSVSICFSKGLVLRSARSLSGLRRSSPKRIAGARCSAEGGVKQGCWLLGACMPLTTMSSAWPKIIDERKPSLR